MTKEIEERSALAELAVEPEAEKPKLSGYAAVFGRANDLGPFVEEIAPGAFTASLATSPDVIANLNHDESALLGRTTSGTLTLSEDETGLRFEIAPPDTSTGRDVLELVRRGDISECSFAFIATNETWETLPDGREKRTILAADLFDVSLVTIPAHSGTSVSLRSIQKVADSRPKAKPVKTTHRSRLLAQLAILEAESK